MFQFSSAAQSCPTLCDPMNRTTPGLPVHHQLPEFTQLMSIELVMPSSHHILYMRLTVSIEGLAECLKHCQQSINVSYLYLSQKTWIILVSSVLLWTIYIISLSHYLIRFHDFFFGCNKCFLKTF